MATNSRKVDLACSELARTHSFGKKSWPTLEQHNGEEWPSASENLITTSRSTGGDQNEEQKAYTPEFLEKYLILCAELVDEHGPEMQPWLDRFEAEYEKAGTRCRQVS